MAKNVIEGVVEKVIFFNKENNYAVALLKSDNQKKSITIVGNVPNLKKGIGLKVNGEWSNHSKYGKQLKIKSCINIIPFNKIGILNYLSSGIVSGIGESLAKKIVKKFGDRTIDVFNNSPDDLLQINGIGESKLVKILESWNMQKEIRDILIEFQQYNISTTYALKIYKKYGTDSLNILKTNPYKLAYDIEGIGFKIADQIAMNVGIEMNSEIRAEAGVIYILREMIKNGHTYYPKNELIIEANKLLNIDINIINDALYLLNTNNEIIIEDDNVYLMPFYKAEENVARKLIEIKNNILDNSLFMDIDGEIKWVEENDNIQLTEMQKEALKRIIDNKLLIITGGPGTGKTTIVNSIIKIVEKYNVHVLLASPTGRAAKRLSELTNHQAKTIHRLLEYNPSSGQFKYNNINPLDCDMLIIDEVSMIDIILMNHLLKAIPLNCVVIFIGDVDQLPSIGAGNVLNDMISSNVINVIRFDEIFRQENNSNIILNAHRINHGEFPIINNTSDFEFMERDDNDSDNIMTTLINITSRYVKNLIDFDNVQILVPIYKGDIGIININNKFQKLYNANNEEIMYGNKLFKIGDKVMQIVNNYEKDVFNGENGRIVNINKEEKYIDIKFDDRIIKYTIEDLDEVILAYAISIHKSQGSEYPIVIIPMIMDYYIMLQRNLLYTAITRAKEKVIMIGSKKAITIAIHNNKIQKRYTGLVEKLVGEVCND